MRRLLSALVASALVCSASTARADEITDWTAKFFEAAKAAATNPTTTARNAAIVHVAVFDAVNGISPVSESIHVAPDADATEGASASAAAVQAAYVIIVKLYGVTAALTGARDASLSAIAASDDAIDKGVEWGQTVADQVWAFSLTDGFSVIPAPYSGGTALGEWRSQTGTNGAGLQIPGMRPWVLKSQSQFRPDPPPALASDRYATDFNETQTQTILTVGNPGSDETRYSLFWNAGTASQLWTGVAMSLSQDRGLSLPQNAHLFARLSMSIADAVIGCWEAKYTYKFWRPFTAIPMAALDGNPQTVADPAWTGALFTTPNHPEYPSGHSCLSGAAGQILSRYFGDKTDFDVVSDRLFNPDLTPVSRSYTSFSAALEEVLNARVFSGIHFRSACEEGQRLGKSVANYVLTHALRPLKGGKKLGHIID
jgi:hypothetical protein